MRQTPVLVVGGGPVGMTVALELARRGVACTLVERNAGTTRHPKMDITNGRSMELFRRLGVADALRAVAVPAENNFDVAWITRLTGHELHRFCYPSVEGWRRRIRETADGTLPAEPPMRVSQVEIEPVLQRAVLAEPLIEARWGVAFHALTQDAAGVTATLRRDDGGTETLRCLWLAGCDGGTSAVRKAIGIGLEGQARVMPRFMTHFRSDARALLQRWGIAWHYQSVAGTLIAQDDRETWTLQTRLPEGEAPANVDPHALLRDFAGCDVPCEILVANAWTPHLLVAERYVAGRVVLAGDAAHQYIPTGGYGMNTGIGDSCGLGWMLAAMALGFGGPGLLAAYDAERRPVGRRNRDASAEHSGVRRQVAALYRPDLDQEAARAEVSAGIAAIGNAENESWGIELGYAYAASPAICAEPGAAIPDDPLRYEPTTAPGVRLPQVVLPDGAPLLDRLGRWFTFVCCGGAQPSDALLSAAARRGVPITVLKLETPELARLYGKDLLLVRPDQHIAWRGRGCEDARQADRIISRVLGWEGTA
jgi:2-polyprenyl-6-methoxyphenol hydroxylase-like FAD-dependent oxidoreductase